MVMKFNHKLIKMIVIILIVCLLSLALTSSSADALVTEVLLTGACAVNPAVALAVAGTILVGAGLTFDNQEKLEVMAAALINNNPVINNLIGGFECMAAASAEFFDFNLTQAAVDELGGWLDGLFSATEAGSTVGNVAVSTGDLTINGVDFSFLSDYVYDYDLYDTIMSNPTSYLLNYDQFDYSSFPVLYVDGNFRTYALTDPFYESVFNLTLHCKVNGDVVSPNYFFLENATSSPGSNPANYCKGICLLSSGANYYICFYRPTLSPAFKTSYIGSGSLSPAVTAAADSTFFPQSTDTDKQLTPGIPLTVPEGLSNLVDLPVDGVRNVSTDIPVDDPFSTVGDIAGEGTGTGIFEGIGNWILNIPILGTIARTISSIFELLQGLLAALINALTGLLDGVVEGITNFFNGIPDVIRAIRDFLANIFNKLGDILSALVGFIGRILAFIPDIITFLLSYELFGSLISKFIPQPVAVVMIAFFLGTVCIWLFRWILNR